MRRLLLLVPLLFGSGCVLNALARGGPNAQCWRTYGKGNTTMFQPTTHGCGWAREEPHRTSQLVAARSQPVTNDRHTGRIRARTMFAGGHLELFGVPAKSSEQVVLAFRPVAKLDAACTLHVFRDEKPLTISELERRSDHELLATLRVDELGASWRFAGEGCGRSFELDEAGRATVASFASRFRERVAIGAQSARSNI